MSSRLAVCATAVVALMASAHACVFPSIGYTGAGGSGALATVSTSSRSSAGSGGGATSVGSSVVTTAASSASASGSTGSSASASSSSGSDAGSDGGGGADAGVLYPLGDAASFAVLGGSTVTNTGATTSIVGDLGVNPGTSITGIPPGMPIGVNHGSDAVSAQAQLDAARANNALTEAQCNNALPMHELAGLTLAPGVYCFNAAAVQLTGNLVLDAKGDPNAVFVFQIGAAFTTADFAMVTLMNGANACNVFWQVGSSATLGKAAIFSGTILAYASITLTYGASLSGRAIAETAAISLDTNSVSVPSCP
jgi:hypothetical protein